MQAHLCLLIVICGFSKLTAYTIPNAKFELLNTGFRVSIPDETGVKNVAFNINRNRAFKTFEAGEFSTQITTAANGRWTYENDRELQEGDVIYIWVNVQHDQLIFRTKEDPIVVHLPDKKIIQTTSRSAVTQPRTTTAKAVVEKKCDKSITVVKNVNVDCKGELIFEDHFDSQLNSRLWKQEVYIGMEKVDFEFVLYEEKALIKDGILHIVPTLWDEYKPGVSYLHSQLNLGARCTKVQDRATACKRFPQGVPNNMMPPVVSGRINTRESFSFKYGRVEIRAKLPKGDWLFPLILLEPLTNHYGQDDYSSGQIRVAFSRGNQNLFSQNGINIDGRTLYGGVVLSTEAALRETSMVHTRQTDYFADDYHVYTMIWTDQGITFKVDNRLYGQVSGNFADIYSRNSNEAWKFGDYMAPFDQEFFLTLGVSAGGHADFPDNSVSNGNLEKPWKNTSPIAAFSFHQKQRNWKPTWTDPGLHVDYVAVYAV